MDKLHQNKRYNLEANKLLAKFLGYTYYGYNDPSLPVGNDPGWKINPKVSRFSKFNVIMHDKAYLCRNHNELRFHSDWNWLMKVVEKIEDKGFNVYISKEHMQIWKSPENSATDCCIFKEVDLTYLKLKTCFLLYLSF